MTAIVSPFAAIAPAPPDPIFGLTEAYNADTNPNKVNLGVGVYQDANGKVPILQAVQAAEHLLAEKAEAKPYLPIDGLGIYDKLVAQMLLGADSPLIGEGRTLTAQAPGGTGALKIGADFLRRFFPESTVWISTPSWENHQALFEAAGFRVDKYPYYNPETNGLDFDEMMAALQTLPPRSIVLLHACCHNPTGVDLTPAQWEQVVGLVQERGLVPFLDFAYQGFGAGIEEDSFAVRTFAASGLPFLIANSFSKSFSLYRERVGALTIVTGNADETKRVLSQVKRVIRTNYSNPPAHGAQIVATILSDPALRTLWEQELTTMRERIHQIRHLFVSTLKEKGVARDFGFITQQRGMFSYSGIPKELVHRLRAEYSLYIVDSGRICVAALNPKNLPYTCAAIAQVL